MKPDRFEDVEFLKTYPMNSVADHEIFMAFNCDSDATAFYEWWHEKGAELFQKWMDKQNK